MSLNGLLLLIPLAIGLHVQAANPILVFFVTAFSMVPLAHKLGDATDDLSRYLGPGVGGLLNATVGTIPDIILGIFALRHGLVEVVKASITGAIVGNLLLGVGLALVVGGRRHVRGLRFDRRTSHLMSGLLMLANIGLLIPAIFNFSTITEEEISLEVSVVLILTYILNVLFTLNSPPDEGEPAFIHRDQVVAEDVQPRMSLKRSALLMAGVTALLALMSEILTNAIEPAAKLMGFTPVFSGIFLLAPVGGAVEMINAVRFARADRLDVALAITLGSSSQMALMAAPILVFVGLTLGQPMNLLLSEFQVAAIVFAVVAVNNALNISPARWISGVKLIAIYLILGIVFYYQP